MRNFMLRVKRVDWGDDPAESRNGMKSNGILGTVWTQDAEHIAFLETALGQVVGHDADRVRQLLVSDGPAGWSIDKSGLVGELFCTVQNERRQRRRRD